MKPAIIIVTYNRPVSLKRLLSFLSGAVYNSKEIKLIISIDYEATSLHDEVVKVADGFNWKYGSKKIIEHKIHLGLKNHVLSCGDLTEEHPYVIVLEDDVALSPFFYNYVMQGLEIYKDDMNIAGISLYSYEWSSSAWRPFLPAQNGADIYFVQHAQSWGQVWSKRMWHEFKHWYNLNKEQAFADNIPDDMKGWSKNSWLKFYNRFCVEENKYFVYPYISLSTNFSDAGTHMEEQNTQFQVPVLCGEKFYNMPAFNSNACRYDIFFEREGLGYYLNLNEKNLCIDLYGQKKNKEKKRFWLTSLKANFKIIKSFGLHLKPHELNIIFNVEGNEIFLYDTQIIAPNKNTKAKNLLAKRILYDINDTPSVRFLEVMKYRLFKKFKKK